MSLTSVAPPQTSILPRCQCTVVNATYLDLDLTQSYHTLQSTTLQLFLVALLLQHPLSQGGPKNFRMLSFQPLPHTFNGISQPSSTPEMVS